MRVAVIGTGVVGQAQVRMLAGHDVVAWDIADGTDYPYDEIAGCEFAVICTGTPAAPDGSADLRYLWQAVSALPAKVPALIRSTVPPGTMAVLGDEEPNLLAYCPEFLHERIGGPWRDSTDVPFMVLGGGRTARDFFRPRLAQVFPGKICECSALEAELAKYAANLHWAAKVTFVNEMARVSAAFGADWARVRSAWLADERVAPIYTSMAGYEPGFGGRCWPKDLSALIAASDTAGYDPRFLRSVRDANARFRVTWDILICSIPHRHDRLLALLAKLDRQMRPGVGVRVYRDNLEAQYGDKCQALLESSGADYVSFADDDDMVAPGFIARVTAALESRPDYVGFPVRWTMDGAPMLPVEHSLRHDGWVNHADRLTRDIAHFNPIRRDLALLGRWEGGYAADRRWSDLVRASGLVLTEEWIPDEMYYYQNGGDDFLAGRSPFPADEIQPLPSYPWLTAL